MEKGSYTENFKLLKPADEDFYNVEDFNTNAELIDKALKGINDSALIDRGVIDNAVVDFNDLTEPGMYCINSSSGGLSAERHQPEGVSQWGMLVVFNATPHSIEQFYIANGAFLYRHKYGSSDFGAWVDLRKADGGKADNVSGFDISKLMNATGTAYTNASTDWDTITNIGVYDVGGTLTEENHQPVGAYGYGTLVVFNSSKYAKTQVYYSHRGEQWFRTSYGSQGYGDWVRSNDGGNAAKLGGYSYEDIAQEIENKPIIKNVWEGTALLEFEVNVGSYGAYEARVDLTGAVNAEKLMVQVNSWFNSGDTQKALSSMIVESLNSDDIYLLIKTFGSLNGTQTTLKANYKVIEFY